MSNENCHNCGALKPRYELKQGWTNCLYCCESCEISHVSDVHGSMPGGALPRRNWVPHHIGIEISRRWED
jgi:hypothetical protein